MFQLTTKLGTDEGCKAAQLVTGGAPCVPDPKLVCGTSEQQMQPQQVNCIVILHRIRSYCSCNVSLVALIVSITALNKRN